MKAIAQWLLGILASCALVSASAHAQTVDVKALAEAMKQGGYVIVFRHGATNRDQADTDPLNYDDIAKQRAVERKRQGTGQAGWRVIQGTGYSQSARSTPASSIGR